MLMKAIVCTKYGPPEVLQLRDVERPTPKSNEVGVRVRATAVTSSDCYIRGFNVSAKFRIPMGLALGFGRPRRPILGMVFAGEVDSVGAEAGPFVKGDQVLGWDITGFGAYAEYKCLRGNGMLALKPSNISYEEAAAIPYGGLLALHYLRKANIQRRARVLVYGASGAVGTSAVQLAKHYGAEVTGVCGGANVALVRALGADALIDYTKEDPARQCGPYDLVLDAVGKAKSSSLKLQCRRSLTPSGRYISVDDGSPRLRPGDLGMLAGLVQAGALRPVIDRVYPLEQIVEAHRYVDGHHKKGNVVIAVG